MRKIYNFRFRTSISREGYENKFIAGQCLTQITAKSIGKVKIAFKEQKVSIKEFLHYAINGYAFCNLFNYDENRMYEIEWNYKKRHGWYNSYPVYKRGINKGFFKLFVKSERFFYGSQTIFIDVDYTKYKSIKEYVNQLTYKPTCAYYSYSDGIGKHGIESRRFRLVYIFDSVFNRDEFEHLSSVIHRHIEIETCEVMSDKCGCSACQYMNGGNNPDTYKSSIIYSKEDFSTIPNVEIDSPKKDEIKEKELSKTVHVRFSKELVNDLNMDDNFYEYVVRKWKDKGLKYFVQTEQEVNGNFYTTDTSDYYKLMYIDMKHPITDGSQRRRKLFFRAAIRRLIKPEVTSDELLYNLYMDRKLFFDNTDGALTINVLKNRVKYAMKMSLEDIKQYTINNHRPKFVISATITDKRAAVAAARADITNQKIASMYDVTTTVKANKTKMEKQGYTIGLNRLYQWCNDYNIKPLAHIKNYKEAYNPELSIRENARKMGCSKYQVEKERSVYLATHPTISISNA